MLQLKHVGVNNLFSIDTFAAQLQQKAITVILVCKNSLCLSVPSYSRLDFQLYNFFYQSGLRLFLRNGRNVSSFPKQQLIIKPN